MVLMIWVDLWALVFTCTRYRLESLFRLGRCCYWNKSTFSTW